MVRRTINILMNNAKLDHAPHASSLEPRLELNTRKSSSDCIIARSKRRVDRAIVKEGSLRCEEASIIIRPSGYATRCGSKTGFFIRVRNGEVSWTSVGPQEHNRGTTLAQL